MKYILGGLGLFTIVGLSTFFFSSSLVPQKQIDQIPRAVPSMLEGSSSFEKGQYYFNHGPLADGTYDLAIAQAYFEKAIQEDPKSEPLLWYQSGRIDFLEGDFDQALKKFQMQLELFGDAVPSVHYMIGLTYGYKARQTGSSADWQKAEEGFEKAIEHFGKAPWPYVDLAWLYFSQGKFAEMKPLLEKSFLVESNNPWLLNMYGLALLNTGDKELAHEYFLFAQDEAALLTVEDWAKSYPGNNPELWDDGLLEFQTLIAKNVALSK
jgi:tetratricopeptide (TPR) repeat protein